MRIAAAVNDALSAFAVCVLSAALPAYAGSLTITSASFPHGVVNVDYPNPTLQATGGSGTLTWSVANGGTIPDNIHITASGMLFGRPDTVGTTSAFTIQVKDGSGQTATHSYTVVVDDLQTGVDNLPTDTAANSAKRAVLEWGLAEATLFDNAGDSTSATGLRNDVTGQYNAVYSLPSAADSPKYFPPIANMTQTGPDANVALVGKGGSPTVAGYRGAIYKLTGQLTTAQVLNPPGYTNVTPPADDIDVAMDLTRAYMYPGTTLYQDPRIIAQVLTRFENVSATVGKPFFDFTYVADIPYEYLMIKAAFPQAILASRDRVWQSRIHQLAQFVVSTRGAHLQQAGLAGNGDVANNWINADVRWFTSLAYAGMIDGADYSTYVNNGLGIMNHSILPDGATNYTDQQNEAQSYHYYYVTELERFSRVTGSTLALALVKDTQWFTPLSQTNPPPGPVDSQPDRSIGEWITSPAWHKYWNGNTNSTAMSAVYGYTHNPYVAWQLTQVGFPTSFDDARYYPTTALTGTPIPQDYLAYDRNIGGVRGTQGPFTFLATTRETPLSNRGKASFVGGMVLKPYDGSLAGQMQYPLSAAVEDAGTLILKTIGVETTNPSPTTYDMINLAYNEHNASTSVSLSTGKFGAISTVHYLSGYNINKQSWLETQAWVLLPTRVIGIVTVQNTADETAYTLDGAFRLISGSGTTGTAGVWSRSGSTFTYGDMAIDVFYSDYGNYTTEYGNAFAANDGKAGWLLLKDARDCNVSGCTLNAYSGSAPTHHFYIAEFRPAAGTSAAATIGQMTFTNGLLGFSFREGAVKYTMVQNPTASGIAYTAGGTVTVAGEQYRDPWLPAEATPPNPPAYNGTIPPYSFIVTTQ